MAQLHKALANDSALASKLTLTGASYTGVSLNDCVAYATEAVEQIVAAELHDGNDIVTGLQSFAILLLHPHLFHPVQLPKRGWATHVHLHHLKA